MLKWPSDERRKHTRFEIELEVEGQILRSEQGPGGLPVRGMITDVSDGGARVAISGFSRDNYVELLRARVPRPIVLECSPPGGDENTRALLLGVIAYMDFKGAGGDSSCIFGISWNSSDKGTQKTVRRLTETLRKASP